MTHAAIEQDPALTTADHTERASRARTMLGQAALLAVLEEALAPFPLNADNPVAARMVLTLKVRVSQLRGDAPGARAALDEMRSLATAGGVRSTHQLARNTARVGAAIRAADPSPQGHEQAGAYEAEAVRLLRQAIDAGYRNAPHVEQDPAFDALREREDFKAVLAELKRLAAEDVAAVVAEENAEDPA